MKALNNSLLFIFLTFGGNKILRRNEKKAFLLKSEFKKKSVPLKTLICQYNSSNKEKKLKLSEIAEANGLKISKKGNSYVALCPFHSEKTPSFHIDDGKNVFYCFGCGESGNILGFLRKIYTTQNFLDSGNRRENLTEVLLRNIQANKRTSYYGQIQLDSYEKLSDLQYSHWYFQKQLFLNKLIKSQLRLRGLSLEVLQLFEIGSTSNFREDLICEFKRRNFGLTRTIKTGLVSTYRVFPGKQSVSLKKEKNNVKLKEIFQNRIIIPIKDKNGAVVGFGGRTTLKMVIPKYSNSKDSNIFKKKRILFSEEKFTKTNLRDCRSVVIVEGYMDSIGLFQNGVRNSVSSLGTSISTFQLLKIFLITRHPQIIISFDNDNPGKKAVGKLLNLYIIKTPSLITNTSVVSFSPENGLKDPEEVCFRQGLKSYIAELNNSKPFLAGFKGYLFRKATFIPLETFLGQLVFDKISFIEPLINTMIQEILFCRFILIPYSNNFAKIKAAIKTREHVEKNRLKYFLNSDFSPPEENENKIKGGVFSKLKFKGKQKEILLFSSRFFGSNHDIWSALSLFVPKNFFSTIKNESDDFNKLSDYLQVSFTEKFKKFLKRKLLNNRSLLQKYLWDILNDNPKNNFKVISKIEIYSNYDSLVDKITHITKSYRIKLLISQIHKNKIFEKEIKNILYSVPKKKKKKKEVLVNKLAKITQRKKFRKINMEKKKSSQNNTEVF